MGLPVLNYKFGIIPLSAFFVPILFYILPDFFPVGFFVFSIRLYDQLIIAGCVHRNGSGQIVPV